MATFTRTDLRSRQTDSADFTSGGSRNFRLINNANVTAYFNIEGAGFSGSLVQVFSSASISNPVSCSILSESTHAGLIIDPMRTASFTFASSEFIPSGGIFFTAANNLNFSLGDNTLSGSAFGVDLNTDA